MPRHFKTPLVVSFDIFGTLIKPRKPVVTQYYELARSHGLKIELSSLNEKFSSIFSQLNQQYPNYGRNSSTIRNADDWWRELIIRVFELEHYKYNQSSKRLCDLILDHFVSEKAYTIYEDVIPTLEYLKHKDIRTIVSSNSDPRILTVLENLSLSKYMDKAYLSYELDDYKPNRSFFNKIASLENVPPELIIHVGDEKLKDCVAAREAGWLGIFVNREGMNIEKDKLESNKPNILTGNSINSLKEICQLLGN